jgi:hypothetical protein
LYAAEELDASSETGDSDDVSAGACDAEFRPLPLDADIENWPCAASIACIAAGDSLPEPELLDFFEPGSAESEPDIVNGSEPLEKTPVDCEDDEACEPIDLTTSHAADAAPKAINMIKPHSAAPRGRCLHYQLSASVVPDKKRNKSGLSREERASQGGQLLPQRQDLPLPKALSRKESASKQKLEPLRFCFHRNRSGSGLPHCRDALPMLGEDHLLGS